MVRAFAAALVAACLLFTSPSARADDVDLALVLAIDVSGSVTADRWTLQRRGYARAFRSPDVAGAIASGRHGAIAVTVVTWSSADMQRQMTRWTVIDGPDAAAAFAAEIEGLPRVFAGSTSISGAIDFALRTLDGFAGRPDRRVIDVSGDGANNSGELCKPARDRAVARGVTINGLPIEADEPGIERFYREHVIGGADAFVVVAADYDAFAEAILAKLVREIAAVPPPAGAARSVAR
jgi:hypothetical protein